MTFSDGIAADLLGPGLDPLLVTVLGVGATRPPPAGMPGKPYELGHLDLDDEA